MVREIIDEIRSILKENADDAVRESGRRFFKEEIRLHGMKTPAVTKIGKNFFAAIKDQSKKTIFSLCDDLWNSGFLEESFIACQWAYALRKNYRPEDFIVFERWVKNVVTNWASCDTLCNHTIGTLVEMYPDTVERVVAWTDSENRWVRRAAAVTLIIPARNGLFQKEIFVIADRLLMDTDDLVQKGYGWMLKAASEADQKAVLSFVMERRATMPRTALRYAIEKMPPAMRAEAMQK